MEISTVTTRLTVLSLTDDEVEHYINHPGELALELIKSGNHTGHIGNIEVVAPTKRGKYKTRAEKKNTPNWATNGNAGNKARGAAVKTTGSVKCAGCGQKFKAQGLGPHQRRCPEYQLKQVAEKAKSQVMSGLE